VPAAFAQPLSLVLSLTEIAVAVALVPFALAWYGACAALALLGVFIIGIAIAMVRGRRPDCHCFGQLHSAPVGRGTLIRNGVLVAIAAWLVVRGPTRLGPALGNHLASAGDTERRLFMVAAVLLCFLFLRALRQADTEDDEVAPEPPPQHQPHDPVLQKVLLEGIGWPIGTPAPDFTLPDIAGQKCSLQSLRDQGKTICLVFSSPHCDPCKALWPHLSRWASEHERTLNIVVVSRGATVEALAKQNQFEASRALLQQEFEISEAYGVISTPAAVLVGTNGLIQSQLAVGREDIQKLLSSAATAWRGPAQFASSS
jgi:peroxiredoxin